MNQKTTAEECQKACQQNKECQYWTWAKPEANYKLACYLKSEKGGIKGGEHKNKMRISGPKNCPECPKKFVNIAGRCYHFSKISKLNQATAATKCKDLSASLATFETLDEWKQVKTYLENHCTLTKYFWIG